ncbi:glycosyltransferase family 4 protein [Pseudomonas tohonis]|nr:glycosyltransferase family 4 protein [Pseudomonas tohonis]
MKIAYLVFHDATSNDGVIKKIVTQVDSWRSQGHSVEVFCITPKLGESILTGKQYLRESDVSSIFKLNYILVSDLGRFSPDLVYFRYINFSRTLYKVLSNYVCVAELNSHDVNEFRLMAKTERTVRSYVRYLMYRLLRGAVLSRVHGMVSVTQELARSPEFSKYSKPIAVVPNSIDLDRYAPIKRVCSGRIGLFFIGTPGQPWQGVEHIERLAAVSPDFDFHVVGYSGSDKENLFFHGYLDAVQYREIMGRCQICIGSLSLYRKGMKEACPLKVREYIAAGFPIFIGYSDTAFLDQMPPWALQVDMREDTIKIRDVLHKFCKEYRDYIVPPTSAEPYVGSQSLEVRRTLFLEGLLPTRRFSE